MVIFFLADSALPSFFGALIYMKDYIEITAKVLACHKEQAEYICLSVCESGIYTEDYTDLESEAPIVGGTEYIDEALLSLSADTVTVHMFFPPDTAAPPVAERLNDLLLRNGINSEVCWQRVENTDWDNRWKEFYAPVEIGERILIRPNWLSVDTDRDIVVAIEPGMSFGSGLHATTRLAAARLEKVIRGGETVLDMGCGSGILGICALKLGAKSVKASDITDAALNATRENSSINKTEDCLKLLPPAEAFGGRYDLIVANIVADVIKGYGKRFYSSLTPGGLLVTSGIISGRQQEVRESLEGDGFVFLAGQKEQEWHEMTFIKGQNE